MKGTEQEVVDQQEISEESHNEMSEAVVNELRDETEAAFEATIEEFLEKGDEDSALIYQEKLSEYREHRDSLRQEEVPSPVENVHQLHEKIDDILDGTREKVNKIMSRKYDRDLMNGIAMVLGSFVIGVFAGRATK